MADFTLGDGTLLVTLTAAGAVDFTFDDVLSVGEFKQSRDKKDLKRLKDFSKSFALGSIATDDVQVEMLSSIDADTELSTLFNANTKQTFALIKPGDMHSESIKFDAYIVDLSKSVPSDDYMKTVFTLGILTPTVAAYVPTP